MLFRFFEDPLNRINMIHFININKYMISINNKKNIKLFSQNCINVAFKACWCVRKIKKYYLVLKMAIPNQNHNLIFISSLYSHQRISTSKVKLYKVFGPT